MNHDPALTSPALTRYIIVQHHATATSSEHCLIFIHKRAVASFNKIHGTCAITSMCDKVNAVHSMQIHTRCVLATAASRLGLGCQHRLHLVGTHFNPISWSV